MFTLIDSISDQYGGKAWRFKSLSPNAAHLGSNF
jgi:hypothetical protein